MPDLAALKKVSFCTGDTDPEGAAIQGDLPPRYEPPYKGNATQWPIEEALAAQKRERRNIDDKNRRRHSVWLTLGMIGALGAGILLGSGAKLFGSGSSAPSTANMSTKTYTPGTSPTHATVSPTVTAKPAKTPTPTEAPTTTPAPTQQPAPTPTQPPVSGYRAYVLSGNYELNKDLTPTNQYDAPGTPETLVCTANIGGTQYAELGDGKFLVLGALSLKQDQYIPLDSANYPLCA